jgi:predicted Zn-dependent protease with MMP-like domain
VDDKHFEQLVIEALEGLPDDIARHLDNVEIVVEQWPSRELLDAMGLAPGQLLFGVYQGIPLTRRTHNYGLVLPDKITIFRGPIKLVYHTDDAIRAQVRHTIIHEIAHHFGISDDRLRKIGAY